MERKAYSISRCILYLETKRKPPCWKKKKYFHTWVVWEKSQKDVLFFWKWKCTYAGREEYLQFIWKDNGHLLRCYLWTWRNKIVPWQIFIIALCKSPDTGWFCFVLFGFVFQFIYASKHFLFLCVLCILGNTPGYMQFRIQNICKERYLLSCKVRTNITVSYDALRYAADEYFLFHFLWMWGEE